MSSIGKAMGGVLRSLGRLVDSAGCALQGRLAYRERCALCLMFFCLYISNHAAMGCGCRG